MNEPELWIYLLIGLTCLLSWLGFRSNAVEEKYIFNPQAILAWKEYYRLVSSAFLHAGWPHLIWNMISLYWFGLALIVNFGPTQFFLIYFGSVIGGNLLSLYVHRHHEYLAYGASGGVCGCIFAYILLFPGARLYNFPLPVALPGWLYAIVFIVGSFIAMKGNNKENVGHDAHLGGAIIGLLIAATLQPRLAHENLKVLLLVTGAAILLLIYLWINPLFLPWHSFTRRRLTSGARHPTLQGHKNERFELDAILEKINKSGMDSLSAQEKHFLHSVSGKYQRRSESKKPESGLAI